MANAKAIGIHEGFDLPDVLREKTEKYRVKEGIDVTYGTARFGPEATDPSPAQVSVCVTNSEEIARYYDDYVFVDNNRREHEAKVIRVCTLPRTFPGRKELAEAGHLNEKVVRDAANNEVLPGFDGIGDATADKIRKALGMDPIHDS